MPKLRVGAWKRRWRDRAAWSLIVFVIFPCSLIAAWRWQKEHVENAKFREQAIYTQRLWSLVVDNPYTGVAVISGETGRIVYWSRGAENILGWKSAQVKGKPFEHILLPEYREKHRGYFHNAALREKLRTELLRVHGRVLHADQTPAAVLVRIRGAYDLQGEYRFVVTFREESSETKPSAEFLKDTR